MNTDTPRTDAAIEILNSEEKASCVHVEFARTLERELGEAIKLTQSLAADKCLFRTERDELKAALSAVLERPQSWSEIGLIARVDSLTQERDQLRAERDALQLQLGSCARDRDQWQTASFLCGDALRNCMGHISGEHTHWKAAFKAHGIVEKLMRAADEKQKAGK